MTVLPHYSYSDTSTSFTIEYLTCSSDIVVLGVIDRINMDSKNNLYKLSIRTEQYLKGKVNSNTIYVDYFTDRNNIVFLNNNLDNKYVFFIRNYYNKFVIYSNESVKIYYSDTSKFQIKNSIYKSIRNNNLEVIKKYSNIYSDKQKLVTSITGTLLVYPQIDTSIEFYHNNISNFFLDNYFKLFWSQYIKDKFINSKLRIIDFEFNQINDLERTLNHVKYNKYECLLNFINFNINLLIVCSLDDYKYENFTKYTYIGSSMLENNIIIHYYSKYKLGKERINYLRKILDISIETAK